MATRRTQPYRKGKYRPNTAALAAMKRGRPKYGPSWADLLRNTQRKRKRKRRRNKRRSRG